MARKSLTDKGVAALKPRAERYTYPDPELSGHYVRVQPSEAKSFVCVARNPDGRQVWTTIADCSVMPISEARNRAREYLQRVRDGLPAIPPRGETFGEVAGRWIKRHVQAKKLISESDVKRLLQTHILPTWEHRPFLEIRRSEVAALLDKIEDDSGPRQADVVLAIIRKMMNWYATRNDNYSPPVVKGMGRYDADEHKRERILNDDEIRAVWKAAESNGLFGALIRMLLLTAQRREKVISMKWADVSVDGEWNIPTEAREKGTAGTLVLPPIAVDIIKAMPHLGDNPFVFAGRGDTHFSGYSKAKRNFDAKLPDLPQWQLHDLRRTARSLMARAGVRPDIAERVMGHAVAGVEGVYDRHQYRDEKADALKRLATLIDGIVNPRSNVTPMKRAKR